MTLRSPLFALALLALPLTATASVAQKIEITPFAGYRFGGDFTYEVDLFGEALDFEVENGESFGAIVDVALYRNNLFLELYFSRQDTALVEESGFFDPDDPLVLFVDLDVEVYHAGVNYQWVAGQVRPFLGGSAGITRFHPLRSTAESEDRFSVGVNGGVKVLFSDHLGVRIEGRAISTFIDDGDDVFCDRYRDQCFRGGDAYFFQSEVLAGLVFAF